MIATLSKPLVSEIGVLRNHSDDQDREKDTSDIHFG